jgi:hypothetical protein
MSEAEQPHQPDLDRAQSALGRVQQMARLSRESYGLKEENYERDVLGLFELAYDEVILMKPPTVDSRSMMELATDNYLSGHSSGIRRAVGGLMIPGTDVPMFLGGGSYSLFSAEDGKLIGYSEDREGFVYGDDTENPHNAAPYTVSKPLALFMFRALGRPLDISDQSNSDLIYGANKVRLHMGGIPVELPVQDGQKAEMMMGISSAELTPAALKHLLDTFRITGAERSIDPSGNEGHFTAAGFMDELAGRVVEAHLNEKKGEELQKIADTQWDRLMAAAIPGPLPGQYH